MASILLQGVALSGSGESAVALASKVSVDIIEMVVINANSRYQKTMI